MNGDTIVIKEIEGIHPMLLVDILLKIAESNEYGYMVSLVNEPEKFIDSEQKPLPQHDK